MENASGQRILQWVVLGLGVVVTLWLLQPGGGSGAALSPGWVDTVAGQGAATPTNPPASPITAAQLRIAYGVTQIPYQGAGKVVAILDVDAPTTLFTDVANFSQANNLPPAML